MEHMRMEQVPATTQSVLDHITCDLCGETIPTPSHYDIDKVIVERRIGFNYPECGSSENVGVDMCGACFTSKLIPWLCSQGAEPRTTRSDW